MIRQQRKDTARAGRTKRRAKGLPHLELLEQREVLDAALRFDFGTGASPLATNFTKVTEATKFNATTGYGWLSGNVQSRDRGWTDAANRDFNFSPDATFATNLANGTYSVSLTIGDPVALHDQSIYLEGQKVDTLTARAGELVTRTYTVTVVDGQLGLRLYGFGGADDNAIINSLVITPGTTAPGPLPPVTAGVTYDFGTATSPVAPGAIGVSTTVASTSLTSAGWRSGQIDSRDRKDADPARRDFHFTRDGLFGAPIANGSYVVTLTMGDSAASHDQMAVFLEDAKVDTITTAKGQFAVKRYTVNVSDGQLSLRLRDLGGSDPYAVINSLTIAPSTSTPPPAALSATFANGGAVNEGSTGAVSFSGVSGGAGGYTYSYDFNNDGTFEVNGSSSQTAVVPSTFLADGPSAGVVRGVVKDSAGATASYTTSLQVNNVAPTASISTASANIIGNTFSFGGSATDPGSVDQTSLKYSWDFGDGATATGQSTSHTYTRSGNYTVRLTVADKDGGSGFATTPITVSVPVTTPPVTATFGNGGAVNEGSTGAVSFSGVSGGAGGYTYSYDFNNDGTFEISGSSSQTAVVPSTFLADGPSARVVRGVVKDSAGATASYTTSLQVNNVAPTASISSASTGVVGNAVAFGGSATDPSSADQASLVYTWDFGDGSTATGASASHAFAAAGTYTVRLTAADKDGGRGTATTTVTVGATTTPPPAPAPTPGDGLRLEFGTETSPTVAGFTKVTNTTTFAAATGYGWTGAQPDARDRGTIDPLGASFNFGATLTFQLDLAPGRYDVRVTSGDPTNPYEETLSFNGVQAEAITTRIGTFHQKSYTVDVGADRRLTVFLDGSGGANPYAILNALEVFATGQLPTAVVPMANPTGGNSGGGPGQNIDVPTSPRPTAGYIVTPAGYIPDFGANPTIVSARSGNWSDPGTWAQGRVPGAGDVVSIAAGATVSYDVYSTATVTTVVVQANGHLIFRSDMNTRLTVNNFLVLEQGELQIGSASNPIGAAFKAEVIFGDNPLDPVRDPEGFGNGLIGLGKVTMYGANKGQTFFRLATEPRAGATSITLAQAAANWAVGDRILLPDTRQLSQDTNPNGGSQYDPVGQYEIVTITAISADRRTLSFATPLRFDHLGARNVNGVLELLPHAANMTRNISLRSASNLGTRGHTLFTGKADVDIHYAAFQGLGRTRIELIDNTRFDANWNVAHAGANQVGRYPVQFKHLVGPTGGQANGFQYTFEGNAITCSMNPQPFRWGVAIDDSHYGSVQNNMLSNWAGAGLVVVSGGETGNVIAGNFVTRTRGAQLTVSRPDARGSFGDIGFEGAGLWMRSFSNYVRDNVVTDSAVGYEYFPDDAGQYHRTPAFRGADTNIGSQSILVDMMHVPILEFARNEVYGGSTAQGLTIWHLNSYTHTFFADAQESVIQDMKIWHVWEDAYFNYMTNKVTFDNLYARGDVNVLIRDQGMGPIGVYGGGHYLQNNFILRNSDIQGFKFGFSASDFGHQIVENTYMRNYIDIVVDTRDGFFDPIKNVPRLIEINNVRFERIDIPHPEDRPQQAFIYMMTNLTLPDTSVVAVDTFLVRQFNGVAGDDFRVMFNEQAADYILPPTIVLPNGHIDFIGSPETGLTNQQAWARHGIAWGGFVAPTNSTHRANINGLVTPL